MRKKNFKSLKTVVGYEMPDVIFTITSIPSREIHNVVYIAIPFACHIGKVKNSNGTNTA